MNKLFTKVASICLGLAMAVGVGVAVSSSRKEATRVDAAGVGEDVITCAGFAGYTTNSYSTANTDRTDVANTTNTSGVTYALQVYNGSSGAVRGNQANATANFSARNTTTQASGYYISSVKLELMSGTGGTLDGSTAGRSVVYFGTSAFSMSNSAPSGTAVNSNEKQSGVTTLTWTNADTSKNYFILWNLKSANTPSKGKLTVTWSAVPAGTPSFSLDKSDVNLTVGGSSTTVTATPNEYVEEGAEYSWTRTAGDDCVTLTNTSSATVTIAPKGTALSASCTLTIAVTGCTSKTVSVTVKKVSSADSPFTITEARSLIAANVSGDMTGVYVHGFVSQVDTFSSPYITYWISDDASTTNQFEVYKGKNLNNTDFSSINDLAIGYEVVVYGNLTKYNSTDEFSKDNYIVSLVRPSTFEVSTTTDGLHLSTDEVGTTGSVTLTTASKYKGTNVVVTCGNGTASINNNVVTLSDVDDDVTINAEIVDAEIVSIALSGYPTKLALDGEFSYSGLVVTGTYDDWVSPHTSEPIASGYTVDSSAVKMDTEGVYTVTVTYGSVNASYQVTVEEVFDNTKGEYYLAEQSDIVVGAHVIIAAGNAQTNYAAGFFVNGNNFPQAEVTKYTNGTISKSGVTEFELVAGTVDGTFGMKIVAGTYADYYAYAVGGTSNNHWKTTTTLDNKGSFTFTKSSDSNWTITASVSGRNTIRYNSGSSCFSCYASGQDDVTVYVFKTNKSVANAYAETFIKGENDGNTCSAIKAAWKSLETEYNNLPDGVHEIFEDQVHESYEEYEGKTTYTVGRAVALYDQILIVNGTSSYNDFMGRTVPGGKLQLSNVVRLNNLVQDSNFPVTVIIIISVMSLAAIAGFAIISKRRHR